jgi:hypothetical protein
MTRFGSDTVTVVTVTEDLDGVRDQFGHPPEIRTEVPVRGCRFRPLPATETTDPPGTTRVSDRWQGTGPAVLALVNIKATDEIQHGGDTYQIIGVPRVFSDLSGRPHHVRFIAARNLG